ncbi:serine threonine protein kinase CMGC group [Ophidiomyces ophidiicola]|nr:serine threonine protein kinase CMGC group [Ophidiomyces ophidiicola]KAI2140048.1 serine threonine protein kinase CMGC group [Ophidiomyces ophidiicola]KAI2428595.1 serine threonine protein kinase CMGC group [Ophidiomyces ophidiicola]KAI2443872.1 serine threonine protein kinase CMGC group [Ophidiomyces ophidiicola]
MSTPSTATATLPANHPPYRYAHHPSFHPNPAAAYSPSSSTMSASRPPAYAYAAPAAAAAAPPVHSMQPQHPPARRKKQPNWGEFYKNGIPKEIIVIDDDDDDTTTTTTTNNNKNTNTNTNDHLPPQPATSNPAYTAAVAAAAAAAAALKPAFAAQPAQPASKKRRTGVDTYDRSYHEPAAYTPTVHPYADASSATSLSTDRTASLHTTAPTSLGSHGSVPSSSLYYDDAAAIGQKRKRVVTRKAARDEQKRRELEIAGDAFDNYIPPPNPPIKAKDVYVPVIRDPTFTKHSKVDDDDGHYIVNPDTNLTDRYTIIKLLGQGTFGKVVEAYDRQKKTRCAVKIIRSVQKYRDASRIELRVLSTLASNDQTNRNKCIHLRDCFDFRNHICIVTDLLGQSVFDFLKSNGFVPFPSSQIQNFARQLFTSVAFLHDVNLIHTDLKPENILLVNGAYQTFTYNRTIPSSSYTVNRTSRQRRVLLDSDIRLIDFGSATFQDEYHSSVVSTRHYRAPEIILNLGWSFACDIWSIGCILVEFFTGDALFQTHDNLEHLAMMESVCGTRIDTRLVRQVMQGRGGANPSAKYFNRTRLDYPNQETSRASRKYVKAMKQLQDFIPSNTPFNKHFLDLLRRIFVYDPHSRITALDALKHPWFKESTLDDGTEAVRIGQQMQKDRAARA